MQKKIRLIATDLDGTVAYVNAPISKENMGAIKHARDNNVHLAVLSGRVLPTLKSRISDFYNDDMFLSACNGAIIYRNGNIIRKKNIENEAIKKICSIAKEMDVFYTMNAQDTVHTLESEWAQNMQQRWDRLLGKGNEMEFCYYNSHGKLMDKVADTALSIILFEKDQAKWQELYKRLVEVEGVSVTSSFESNIEVMGASVTKAYALKNICDILEIDVKDAMAIGDNYNDLDMIKLAGTGVAMGNADDFIKQNAEFVTKTCEQDGFAHAVYKYL